MWNVKDDEDDTLLLSTKKKLLSGGCPVNFFSKLRAPTFVGPWSHTIAIILYPSPDTTVNVFLNIFQSEFIAS